MTKYFFIGGGVLLLALLAIFFGPDLIGNRGSADPLAERLATIADLAERTCLSNTSEKGSAQLETFIQQIKGLRGGGNIQTSREQVRGAAEGFSGELLKQENNQIRDCMAKFRDQMLQLLAGPQAADNFPKGLVLKIRLPTSSGDTPAEPSRFILGVFDPPRAEVSQPLRTGEDDFGEYLYDNVVPPEPDGVFDGLLVRQSIDGTKVQSIASTSTKICLKRNPRPPSTSRSAITFLHCALGEACSSFDQSDVEPRWLVPCESKQARTPGSGVLERLALISSAYAAQNSDTSESGVWAVPSLSTIAERKDLVDRGYTVFKITSADLRDFDADAVRVDLAVNGTRVLIDGLQPEYRALPFDPQRDFEYSFGLQNLDFDGRNGGCELVSAKIQFVKRGYPVGDLFEVVRPYVALRSASRAPVTSFGKMFLMEATYTRPPVGRDWEVFIASRTFSSLNSTEAIAVRNRFVDEKRTFDALKLRDNDGTPLVAVVRPPLRSPWSYSLVVAKQLPTGQINFTFPRREAEVLRNFIVAASGQRRDVRAVVGQNPYLYEVKGGPVSGESGQAACA